MTPTQIIDGYLINAVRFAQDCVDAYDRTDARATQEINVNGRLSAQFLIEADRRLRELGLKLTDVIREAAAKAERAR